MLEKELESKLRERVKKLGGKAYKFTSPGNAGVPDRLVILPDGVIGFAEMKRTGVKPTISQEKRIEELEKLGCFVRVVDSEEKIEKFIEELEKWHKS